MIFVQPAETYAEQSVSRSNAVNRLLTAPLADLTGWDEAILHILRCSGNQPILIVRVVNLAVKTCRHNSTRHRDAMRTDIFRAIGSMVRRGRLVRVKRRFVVAL